MMPPGVEQAEGELPAVESQIGIAEYTPQGHLTRASPRFLSMLGYRPDEVHDIDHRDFSPRDIAKSDSYAHLWIRLRAGEIRRQKERRIAKGDCDVWVDTTYVPIRDGRGTVCSVIEFACDISGDVRQDHAATRHSGAADTVLAMVQFDTLGTIRDFNDGFLRMVGYSAESLLDQHHSILCPAEESGTQAYREFWLSLTKGEAWTGYFTLFGQLGREIFVLGSYLPIRSLFGGIDGIVLFAFEVTKFASVRKSALASAMTALASIEGRGAALAENETELDALEDAIAGTRDDVTDGKTTDPGGIVAVPKVEKAIRSIREAVGKVSQIATQTDLLAIDAVVKAARSGGSRDGFIVTPEVVRRDGADRAVRGRDIAAQLRVGAGGTFPAVASLDASSRQLTVAVSRVQSVVAASVAEAEKASRTAEVLRAMGEGARA